MNQKHECSVVEVREDAFVILLSNEERKTVSNTLISFEALVDDELFVFLDDSGEVTRVEQKEFSRGYVLEDLDGKGAAVEVYVSSAREIAKPS